MGKKISRMFFYIFFLSVVEIQVKSLISVAALIEAVVSIVTPHLLRVKYGPL
jgi:hypothetical protein